MPPFSTPLTGWSIRYFGQCARISDPGSRFRSGELRERSSAKQAGKRASPGHQAPQAAFGFRGHAGTIKPEHRGGSLRFESFRRACKILDFLRPRMAGRGPREVGMTAVCGAGGSKRPVARHPGAHGAAEEVGGAAGLDGMASVFLPRRGCNKSAQGRAERRPGEDVVFNRLP